MSEPLFIEAKEYDECGNASPVMFVEYGELRFMAYSRDEAQAVVDQLTAAQSRVAELEELIKDYRIVLADHDEHRRLAVARAAELEQQAKMSNDLLDSLNADMRKKYAENARLLAALEWAEKQAWNYSSVFAVQIERKIKEARG